MTHQPGMTHGSETIGAQSGQAAFGALQEVVAMLETDPATDWEKVNISALRSHLVDMDALVLDSQVSQRLTQDGFVATVRGNDQVVSASQRMVTQHVSALQRPEWRFDVIPSTEGIELVAHGSSPFAVQILQGLGFFGVMATDSHHAEHHFMLATGQLMPVEEPLHQGLL
jgi:hypothetical protein